MVTWKSDKIQKNRLYIGGTELYRKLYKVPMQIALSLGGILAMIVAAMLLSKVGIKPKRQPRHDEALAHGDFMLVRSQDS